MKLKEIFKKQSSSENADYPGNNIITDMADRVIQELLMLQAEGVTERSIEEYIADAAFSKLAEEFPVKAAVRIYDAEMRAKDAEARGRQSAVDEIYKRRSMPQSIRAERPMAAETDFSKMTSEEFAKLKKRLAQGR